MDNFEQIKELLFFDSNNDFYVLNILKRRKDPGNEKMQVGVKSKGQYYIYSKDDLDRLKEKIINTCNINNARCYIILNKRDKKVIALQTLKLIADMISAGQYECVKDAYQKACGRHSAAHGKKRFILDIDNEEDEEIVKDIVNGAPKIPTPNGYHYLLPACKETATLPNQIVHKDGSTILYSPNFLPKQRIYPKYHIDPEYLE